MSDDIKLDDWTCATKTHRRPVGECPHCEIEALEARVAELERAIRLQANAVRTLADASAQASSRRLELARQAEAESRPELIESERAANARLTEELDAARAEAEANRKDAERYRWFVSRAITWEISSGETVYWIDAQRFVGKSLEEAIDAARGSGSCRTEGGE